VPLGVIEGLRESVPGCELENILGGVIGSVPGVYFTADSGACNEVHLAVMLNAA